MIGKAVEIADLCVLKINLLVNDPKFHRLKEHYTDKTFKLEVMHHLEQDLPNLTKSRQQYRQLKF